MSLFKRKTFVMGDVTFKFDPHSKWMTLKAGGQKYRIEKKDIYTMAFVIGDDKTQEALIPMMRKEMMVFERFHKVKAEKDIKAGELVQFHCHVDVATLVIEDLLKKAGVANPKEIMDNATREDIHSGENLQGKT